MNQHISNTRVGLFDRVFYLVRNIMSLANRNPSIYANMQVNIEGETHLADETLLDIANSRNRDRGVLYSRDNIAWRSGIQHFTDCGNEQATAIRRDDRTGEKCCPCIRASPSFATN